ncbi:MAG: 23S rRNA (adenine(2503)-C(2))-methyltransferase RlmN [Persicimonas sp.]
MSTEPIKAAPEESGPNKHVQEAIAHLAKLQAGESDDPIDLMDFSLDELQDFVTDGLDERSFRADQLFEWIYCHLAEDFDEMTNLSKDFRARLDEIGRIAPVKYEGAHPTGDGTTKLMFRCDDDAVIETVLIPADGRNTLCISSQVGCAMGCTFCYTAKMGLKRQLSTAEIVAQVVLARRLMTDKHGHVGNIVFMGMGEPLHNYDNVVRAVHILTNQIGLDFSRRRVTLSTSGLVPQLERFGRDTDVQLAVSLNGTTDEQRSKLMPVNDRWGIDELLECLRNYPLENRQRITFEYILIKGITDRIEDADRLAKLVDDIPCKVNIIPFNPHPETPFETPSEERIDAFQEALTGHGVHVLRRRTRGREEMAACGQLGQPGEGKLPAHLRKRLEKFQSEAKQP